MKLRAVIASLAALAAGHPSSGAAADRPNAERDAGLLTLRSVPSRAVYLRPLAFEMGSTQEEVLAALERCKREPLPDRCDESSFDDETPVHGERVAGFWMSRTEVTVANYARCVSVGRCRPAAFDGGASRFAQPNLPVTLVTFDDAKRYCAFRGGRLPTEAEFERAARGPARRPYPWGSSYHGKLSNHGRASVDTTDASDGFAELAPVGSFPDGATPEGILDLAGNAAEWTADAFTSTYGAVPNGERVVRGGSFVSGAAQVRGAARVGKAPETREPALGFRCAWQVRPLRE
jgi:formylglycine-generating enzyme required for sulfatase activity